MDPKAFTIGDIQGFTGYSKTSDAIVISFRGSNNIENWIKNIEFAQVGYSRCNNCKVHDGFNKAYNMVKQAMLAQIQQLKAKFRSAKIYLTGHSLGGAIAVLAAPDIKELYGTISAFYTFGQPRVGNSEFAAFVSRIGGLERVIHYADIVPHLMP